ncbi:MAG: energy-coupling factor transporter transmembrane protein EcfT [Cellulosilyticum sp.]|nr:energy-coupling factor transporter transmembrane protein EcfT [Cellulosilyticum sp.]
MQQTFLGYIEEDSLIHRLTGATKLICLVLCTLTVMLSYDTRILAGMFIFSFIVFKLSKIRFQEIAFVFYFIVVFLVLNNIAIFLFSPLQGVEIYGSRTELFRLTNRYVVTKEQLFYHLNVSLKYFAVIPIAILFMVATNPSEFAASLNKIGISYKVAYAVAIALRYIPDIQRDYHNIAFAQQARGVDLSKKEKLARRMKNISSILMPLIFTSLERIETISCAMELRAFGEKKKRTWYSERAFQKQDYIAIVITAVFFLVSLWVTYQNGSRFYNPF